MRWSCCGGPDAMEVREAEVRKRGVRKSASTGLRAWSNERLGKCLFITDLETRQGILLRVAVALLYLTFAVGTVIAWHYFGNKLHVVFWLGYGPQIALLVTMLAIAASFLLLTRVRIIRYFRFQEMRVDHQTNGLLRQAKIAKAGCTGRLRPTILLSFALSLGALALGLYVDIWSRGIEKSLQRQACPHSLEPHIQHMEETSAQLVKFQRLCHEKTGDADRRVGECPSFVSHFSDSSKYVSYILRLETQTGCTGFCDSTDALVLEGRKHESADKLACADVISRDVRFASLLATVPSVIIGFISAFVALFVYEYDDL